MPERHLDEFRLYYSKQPFGLWRDDFRAAKALAHTVGGTPGDYMPFFVDEEAKQVMQVERTMLEMFPGTKVIE